MADSEALTYFKQQMTMAKSLIALESKFKNPPLVKDRPAAQALRGGAVVLMVAAFEYFLKDAMEEHLTILAQQKPKIPFEKLPVRLQVNSVFNALKLAMDGPRHGKTGSGREVRLPEVQEACKTIVAGLICPEAFSSTGSNPSSETVHSMFHQVDIDNIFGVIKPGFDRKWAKPEVNDFIKLRLNEIVQMRHKVAHTANTLDITRTQLHEAVKFLTLVATLLDGELHNKVRDTIAAAK